MSASQHKDSIKSFIFLAVPLLVIIGEFLIKGDISRKLIAFSRLAAAS